MEVFKRLGSKVDGAFENFGGRICNFFSNFWENHICSDFPEELPPFCFDCNFGDEVCKECPAYAVYKEYGIEEGDKEFKKMQKDLDNSLL